MATAQKEQAHQVVSRDEWLVARKKLLDRERALTHERDAISAQRRELPWVKVEKDYVFDTPRGKKKLSELFDGRSQLIVYHFMFGPTWEAGCPSCAYLMDHVDGALPHLHARDVTFMAVSRGPIEQLQRFKERLGWKFPWVSSAHNDFNYDFHVAFRSEDIQKHKLQYNYEQMEQAPVEDLPGLSVFFKNRQGEVFHTYSTYARGLDPIVNTYNYLDLTPKGRNEDNLAFSMAWVRYHDRYDSDYVVDVTALYQPPKGAKEPQ